MKNATLFFSAITVSFLTACMIQPAAEAYSAADVAAIRSGQNCPNADLRHADLSGADLTGLDLTGADLQSANLKGARLERTVLDRPTCRAAI